MFKKIDDRSELFFSPIPKWITRTGFVILVCILLALVLASSYMRYPHTVNLPVVLDGQKAYSRIDFATYRTLRQGTPISIDIPTRKGPLKGILDLNGSIIEKDRVSVPITINSPELRTLQFRGELHSHGEIVLDDRTLLQKLVSKNR